MYRWCVTAMIAVGIRRMKLPIPERENRSRRPPSERSDDFAAISARSVTENKRNNTL